MYFNEKKDNESYALDIGLKEANNNNSSFSFLYERIVILLGCG